MTNENRASSIAAILPEFKAAAGLRNEQFEIEKYLGIPSIG